MKVLMEKIRENDYSQVFAILNVLDTLKLEPNVMVDGMTPLELAQQLGYKEIAVLLYEYGADLD